MTKVNKHYRRAIATTAQMQLVLMSIPPGEEVGMEVHARTTQFVRIEQGLGEVVLDGTRHSVREGSAVVISAGVYHNIVNTGSQNLKLYTLYAPPEHEPDTAELNKN